jgi:cytochrome b6-f complex iron-sulfur subunit
MSKNRRQPEDSGKPNVESDRLNRRRFLTWLTRGSLAATVALAIGQAVRFLSFQPPNGGSTVIPVGQPGDYPPGALVYVAEARTYVGHDEEGLYALDAVCTHLGCLVEWRKGGFVCPCHGSDFDAVGQAQTGPATKPLRYLYLSLDQDGQLMVDRAQSVEPAARLTA